MGHLPMASVAEGPKLEGQKLGINYGFDRIRFPSPVPVGTKVRATSTLKRVEIKGGMLETMNEVVVEAQGQINPSVWQKASEEWCSEVVMANRIKPYYG